MTEATTTLTRAVTLDVRDESYLIAQLGKQQATFFRFFGSTKSQVTALFGNADPLRTVSGRLQHALLATLGAYVLSDRARMARGTLFDPTRDGRTTFQSDHDCCCRPYGAANQCSYFDLIRDFAQPRKLSTARNFGSGQGLHRTIARASRGSISARRKRRLNR